MQRAVSVFAAAMLLLAFAGPAKAYRGAPPGGPAPFESAFQVRLGGFMPSGDSSFWDDTEEVFTLDESDFDEFIIGFTFVHPVSNEVELGINVDFYEETVRSQYRDVPGPAIFHDTQLSLAPVTFDVRFLPGGRYRLRPGGRQILKPVFYIGGGIGINFWEYEEVGDFVDFDLDVIFFDRFIDDGAAFEVHGLAGVEIPVAPSTNVLFEARFSSSDDDLGGDFGGLPATELELGGTSVYGGVSFRF